MVLDMKKTTIHSVLRTGWQVQNHLSRSSFAWVSKTEGVANGRQFNM